jgi:putative hydrolase of the HAD superfamily
MAYRAFVEISNFEAISFDCYGTLIDWETGLAAVLGPWARSRRLELDDQVLLAAYGRHEAREENAYPRALYPDIVARTFRALGQELEAEVTEEDAQRLARSVPEWPPFGDSAEALAALGERFKLIILSNVDRESFAGSARQLGTRFDAVLTAQDVGCYKPSRRNFDALLAQAKRMGVGEGRLVHAAQSLFHDHIPAKRAGLPTVWINRHKGRPGWGATPEPTATVVPDWEFPSMAAFAATAMA